MSGPTSVQPAPLEPDSCWKQCCRLLRHERRCWRRVRYWLGQFSQEAPVWRCSAWHRSPQTSVPADQTSWHDMAG